MTSKAKKCSFSTVAADVAAERARRKSDIPTRIPACIDRTSVHAHPLPVASSVGLPNRSAHALNTVSMEPRLPQDPVQLRALLLKVQEGSRSRTAALQAELAGLGGHAPAAANPTEPSAEELEREESPALQQLIRQALSQWYRPRSLLEAAI